MTTNTTNTTIKYRSKFEKLLNDENRSAIMSAFEKFLSFKMDIARDYLWSLTYNSDIAMLVLEELGLNRNIITLENILTLRNELRFQYKELKPEFLECDVPTVCRDAYTALEKKSDSIVANIVFRNCSYCIYDDEEIKRTLFLLKSEKDNNRFGGIRSMSFGLDEADYLKQFHMQIHDLLKAFYEYHKENEKALKNMPFAGLDEQFKDDSFELPFELNDLPEDTESETAETTAGNVCVKNETAAETTAEEAAEQNNAGEAAEITAEPHVRAALGYKALTPEEILEHKVVFAVFAKSDDLNVLLPIGTLGFDLNEVMAKKEKIYAFLKAVVALSE